jgi:hypothetical protein
MITPAIADQLIGTAFARDQVWDIPHEMSIRPLRAYRCSISSHRIVRLTLDSARKQAGDKVFLHESVEEKEWDGDDHQNGKQCRGISHVHP